MQEVYHKQLTLLFISLLCTLWLLTGCVFTRNAASLQRTQPLAPPRLGLEMPAPPLTSQPLSLAIYLATWNDVCRQAVEKPFTPNPEVKSALPPSEFQLRFQEKTYIRTFPLLLQALAETNLSPELRNYLQKLALLHQQQEMLVEIFHAVNDLQHAKKEALSKLLASGQKLRDFQSNFQKYLPDTCAAPVNAELSPWLKLWEGRDPLDVLPSLWTTSASPLANKTPRTPSHATRFSEVYDARTSNSELYEILRILLPKWSTIWLHQDFEAPVVAAGRCAFLIFPALPKKTHILLNDKEIRQLTPGKPFVVQLTDDLIRPDAPQHLAISFLPKELGAPTLPVCLAAGPEL